MKVRIYYNFHKKLFSVQEKVNGSWKVVEYTKEIFLRNATFKVSEAGRQRVLKEKRKNVHAFVEGEYSGKTDVTSSRIRFVRYNPYIAGHFIDQDSKQKITEAAWAWVTKKGIMAI